MYGVTTLSYLLHAIPVLAVCGVHYRVHCSGMHSGPKFGRRVSYNDAKRKGSGTAFHHNTPATLPIYITKFLIT
jgi:hypothetical protein